MWGIEFWPSVKSSGTCSPFGPRARRGPSQLRLSCCRLGVEARLVSRIGDDALGHEILERFREFACRSRHWRSIRRSNGDGPGGAGPGGQPRFTITGNVAWDRIEADEAALELAARADAIYFGSLAQRSEPARQSIRKLIAASPTSALKVFDVNLRPSLRRSRRDRKSLKVANLLKLNDQELPVFAQMFGVRGGVLDQVARLAGRFNLMTVVLTRGERVASYGPRGAVPITPAWRSMSAIRSERATPSPPPSRSGFWPAGGSTAINQRANEVAAYVCTKPGGMPRTARAAPHSLPIAPGETARGPLLP